MTPLAMNIAKELTLPKARRTFEDNAGVLSHITEAHCFDVTEVAEMIRTLEVAFEDGDWTEGNRERLFLPAPVTWIEMRMNGRSRCGILLVEEPHIPALEGRAGLFWAVEHKDRRLPAGRSWMSVPGWAGIATLDGGAWDSFVMSGDADHDGMWTMVKIAYAALAIINSVKMVGRRVHQPHAGLQRRLAAARGMVGRFPLQAWTEIKLQVTPPPEHEGERPAIGYLTGRRALHFVRAHLRVVNGKLVYVKAHWRGDAAVGIKQSRYVVTA